MRRVSIPSSGRDGAWIGRRVARTLHMLALGTGLLVLVHGEASAQFIDGSTARTPREQRAFGGVTGKQIAGPIRRGDKATPLFLNADELEYDTRNNRVIARGNVEIYYNNYALTADRVVYDQAANTITAEGNAKVREPDGAIVSAERLVASADFAEAFVQSLSVVGQDDTRIVARRAIRRDGNVTEFEGGKFTPCKSEAGMPPLWCIAAGRVIHDKDKATITYQDAQFELFGVPILYTPYFQHADPSVKSRTGFLIPDYSSSSRLGASVEVPYHITVTPSADFLFHPMYMAKQGVLWQGHWRQKLRMGDVLGTYEIKLAGIDQNSDQTINGDLRERWRGSVHTRGNFSISSWWNFGWDVVGETDRAFRQFYKLDNILQKDRVNTFYLQGRSERNFFGMTLYHVGGLVMNPNLDTTPPGTDPSLIPPTPSQAAATRVMPVVDYNYIFAKPVLGGELSFNANAVSYWQDLAFTDGGGVARRADSNANRVTANVGWRRTFTDTLGQTFTPAVSLRGDIINFEDTVDPLTRLVQPQESIVRGVGTASLTYAYPWAMATSSAVHTIEPIGQVQARQARIDQRRLPDLDARSTVFDDMNLFEDKTAGYDRIDTGVRMNYGLQYTMQAYSGGSVRLLAGQSFHLSGDNIFRNPGVDSDNRFLYSPVTGLERQASDYVLGLYVSPVSGFRALAQARIDENTRDLRRVDTLAGFNYGPMLSQVSYSYTAASPALNLLDDQQEILAMLGFRVTDRWTVSGQTRFSLNENRAIQNIAQLKYADDCYVMTASYVETHITDVARDLKPDRALLLRFELKYLGEFKYKTSVLDHVFADNQTSPR
jgi:LPS-assembly protein